MVTKEVYIKGAFGIIIALISLVGGYLLKDPIDKAFFKPHCDIGGLWKPHGDLMLHCEVTKFKSKNNFKFTIVSTMTDHSKVRINCKGVMDGDVGTFEGTWASTPNDIMDNVTGETTTDQVTGEIGLQGCDGLGINLRYSDGSEKTYAFIREGNSQLDKDPSVDGADQE